MGGGIGLILMSTHHHGKSHSMVTLPQERDAAQAPNAACSTAAAGAAGGTPLPPPVMIPLMSQETPPPQAEAGRGWRTNIIVWVATG